MQCLRIWCWICLTCLFGGWAGSATAAVTLVGTDTTTDKDWRRPLVTKVNDLDGNQVYGTDGFILFEWQRANFNWSAPVQANHLSALPSYIDGITSNTFANAYRNDTDYGQLADPDNPYLNHPGTVLAGQNSWMSSEMDKIVLKRRGYTGAFGLTVFAAYYSSAISPLEQVWVHTGTDSAGAVRGDLTYTANKTVYVTFRIPAGAEDITIRFYSQANHISGLAFDGYKPQIYHGAGIAAVGRDRNTNAAWLVPSGGSIKPNDADGNNVYGTDGFYLFEWTRSNFDWSARDAGKDLKWLPNYIDSISSDTFANGYRNDPDYGPVANPDSPDATHPGTAAAGQNSWVTGNFDKLVIKRHGTTGAFALTVFSSYYSAATDSYLQVWAYLGTALSNAVLAPITYTANSTGYVTFYIPAGSEDITLRFYSQANHVSGLAFDGLQAKPYTGAPVLCLGNDYRTTTGWRSATAPKVIETDGVYGSDGFSLFEWNRGNWVWGARTPANDLRWLPTYIADVTDDFANGYRSDGTYGEMDDPSSPGIVRPGTVAAGKLWDFNTVTVSRNGNTGPFNLTVFSTYYDNAMSSNTQVWVHVGANQAQAVRGDLQNISGQTRYVTFRIAGGTENVTIRAYAQATHLSGVAFDGLSPRPFGVSTSLMHYDAEGTVSGEVHYTSGTVTITAPTNSSTAYEGASSVKTDFNTGDANGVYGSIAVWATWKQLPLNMDTLSFASNAPAGLVFSVAIQDDDWAGATAPWWGIHHTPLLTQTVHNGWQLNEIKLADLTEPINPATLGAKVGTVFIYIHGAQDGGQSGISGSAYFDAFQFKATPVPVTRAANWSVYE
jgi:hypothetical protein